MISEYRKMRILLFFDLPTVEKNDSSNAQKFVKSLKKLGFTMLQYSVYTKVLINDTDTERVISKMNKIIPARGNIIIMKLTEKQYSDMIYLVGEKNKYDRIVGNNNVVYFGGDEDS